MKYLVRYSMQCIKSKVFPYYCTITVYIYIYTYKLSQSPREWKRTITVGMVACGSFQDSWISSSLITNGHLEVVQQLTKNFVYMFEITPEIVHESLLNHSYIKNNYKLLGYRQNLTPCVTEIPPFLARIGIILKYYNIKELRFL